MMRYNVTFRADGEVVIKVDASNHEEAKKFAVIEIAKMFDFNRVLNTDKRVQFLNPLILTKVERQFYPIMTPYNSHNKDLVNKINELWNSEEKHNRFQPILVAFMQRDLEEMYDKNCFGEASDEKVEKFFDENVNTAYLFSHWEDLAEYYLMRVADDVDLQCIIDFIR